MDAIAHARGGQRRGYRTIVAAFALGLICGLSARGLNRSAYADLPSPANQRLEMNEGIARLNGQVAEILSLLRSGTLKVRVVETDKTSGTLSPVLLEPSAGGSRGTDRGQPGAWPAGSSR
ncbi:MAG TPA: hypothetical protein PL151_16160 [Phycisphaerae bacterium]|nr:hypothetical protein [Phycisphaerae bacterium]HOJ74239.1 hypothetical protein [Phycisphaerae bacterium]HOM51318.1 hypothetical protein [Phycisphaerae bacterium]HON65126.1 hypothetical protein [Phycisphaerae bacterium]HOQ86181.1 hypothetical protein [Phycisphaerae bacterium]